MMKPNTVITELNAERKTALAAGLQWRKTVVKNLSGRYLLHAPGYELAILASNSEDQKNEVTH